MNIKIERKKFADALAIGSCMAGKSKVSPILDNAKITIKDNYAIISSFDSEVAITKKVEIIESDEQRIFCVNPKNLLDILGAIKDETVDILIDDMNISVKHLKGTVTIPVVGAEEFPAPNVQSGGHAFHIEAKILHNMVGEARFFISQDSLRPVLCGIYFTFGGNKIEVCASDGMTLYNNSVDCECSFEEDNFVVGSKAIDALLRMSDSGNMAIYNTENNIVFKTEDTSLIALKPNGRYPNYRNIIPHNLPICVEVESKELQEGVRRAMIAADKTTSLIKMDISPMTLSLSTEDASFSKKAEETVCATCSGGSLLIGLKGVHIQQCLSVLKSETVYITLSQKDKPTVWKETLNGDKLVLIMPFLIQ